MTSVFIQMSLQLRSTVPLAAKVSNAHAFQRQSDPLWFVSHITQNSGSIFFIDIVLLTVQLITENCISWEKATDGQALESS